MIISGSHRLLEMLDRHVETVVPKGWKTVAEICKDMGLSISQGAKIIREAVEGGVLEKRKFRIVCGEGTRPVMHYKRK